MTRLAKSKHFQELLAEINERWMDPPSKTFACITLLNRSFLSKVWHCRAVTYISRKIREEIAFVLQQCQEHLSGIHRWKRPISHIVRRRPDAYARQDASTDWGMGGYCSQLKIWWQLQWSDLGEEFATKVREKKISINVLELAAIVVNYLAVVFGFATQDHGLRHQPRVHVGGDNTTADAWYKKFSNTNDSARGLTKILAFLMKNCNVGMDVEHVAGILNFFADAISRGLLAETLNPLFKCKCPSNTGALSCLQVPLSVTEISFKRFLPSAEMLSAISSTMLLRSTPTSLATNPKQWGRCIPDNNISFDFSNDWNWMLH